jgi:hypothetical protein
VKLRSKEERRQNQTQRNFRLASEKDITYSLGAPPIDTSKTSAQNSTLNKLRKRAEMRDERREDERVNE